MRPWARTAAGLGLVLALAACGDDVSEIARAPAPDGAHDAVVGQIRAGENRPFFVGITNKAGDNVVKVSRVLLVDGSDAPKLAWDQTGRLTVSCTGGRVWTYRNFWSDPNTNQVVAIALQCGTEGWGG